MFEQSYWVAYLSVAIAWGLIGLALLAYRAGLPKPLDSFPFAAVGFVGAGVVCALLAGLAYSSDRDDGAVMVALVVAGVLTPVIGFVASLFVATEQTESEEQ